MSNGCDQLVADPSVDMRRRGCLSAPPSPPATGRQMYFRSGRHIVLPAHASLGQTLTSSSRQAHSPGHLAQTGAGPESDHTHTAGCAVFHRQWHTRKYICAASSPCGVLEHRADKRQGGSPLQDWGGNGSKETCAYGLSWPVHYTHGSALLCGLDIRVVVDGLGPNL